jgi:hypothetical protein
MMVLMQQKRLLLEIVVLEIKLFEEVRLLINFLDDNNDLVRREFLNITGEDYSNWTGDNYILNLISQRLNLSNIQVVVEE